MDDWLTGYDRHPVEGCTGPGTYVAAPWRLVVHTTESGAGSMGTLIPFFAARPCSTPHFAIDPATGERVQFIRLGWSAAALAHPAGTVETNRAHAVQVEVIGRAAETHTWPDEWLRFVGEFVADLVRAGVPLNLDNVPAFLGQGDGVIATASAKQRMAPAVWLAFDGVCGHQHVPGNDHWDPGRLNMQRVIEHAKASLGGGAPVPEPDPTPPAPEDDMYHPVNLHNTDDGTDWLWDGGSAPVPVGAAQLQTAANLHNAGSPLPRLDVNGGFIAEMLMGRTVTADAGAVAASILATLGPNLARSVVDELTARLAS